MSEEKGKKNWKSPELIVLVRNKPEEAVLAGCKNSGNPTGDILNSVAACNTPTCSTTCNMPTDS